MLEQAGWLVQDVARTNLDAGRGIAIREFPLKSGHGFADYLLYVDQQAVGVVEAKREGTTLTGVEAQARKYSEGLPAPLPAPVRPLPFCYQSTGVETRFTCGLDPEPRSRRVFHFYRPETLSAWLIASAPGRGTWPMEKPGRSRAPTTERFGKPVSGSLPTIVRSFKSAATKHINELRSTPGASLWQRDYHEHVIRDEDELQRIREYVLTNPLRWELNRENLARRGEDEFDRWLTSLSPKRGRVKK